MPENEQLPNEPTEIAAQISEPYIELSASVLPETALFEGTVAVSTGLRDFEKDLYLADYFFPVVIIYQYFWYSNFHLRPRRTSRLLSVNLIKKNLIKGCP